MPNPSKKDEENAFSNAKEMRRVMEKRL